MMFGTTQSLLKLALAKTLNTRIVEARGTNVDSEPGSIGLLPVELLLDIFEQLDRNTLLTCMRVCKRWFDIAGPSFFATVPVRHHQYQRFAKHVRAYPRLAEFVRDLRFFDRCWGETGNKRHMDIDCCPFDVQLLASALPFLPNLRNVSIVGYENKLHAGSSQRFRLVTRPQVTPHTPPVPVALQRLTLGSCQKVAFILHGLLPFFTVNTLVTDAFLYSLFGQGPRVRFETLFPPASLVIQNVVLRGTVDHFYEFFEHALAPGCLRGLGTGSWWRGDLPLLDRFLQSGAAQNLQSLSIGAVGALHESWLNDMPVNPGPSLWSLVGATLARCPRLQYVRVGFEQRGHPDEDPFSRGDALVPMLECLPVTLRAFALDVWILVFPGFPHGSAGTIRSLDGVDRMLDPAGEGRRFRELKRVELRVHYLCREGTLAPSDAAEAGEGGSGLVEVDREVMPLPRLLASGLLREYHVEETERHPDRYADVYWPTDK